MILLLKNHKVKRKKDCEVTKEDLKKSEYIMIDTAIDTPKFSKHYVLVDPSKIPWFTRAVIKYQMLFICDDHDEGLAHVEPLLPVETEVTSISDLINIMNCVDRLYVANQMISNDQYLFVNVFVTIGYLEVALYNEKKKIYHKVYQNKKNLEERYGKAVKFPLIALKKFKDIYNTDIIINMTIRHEMIYFHKDLTWEIAVVSSKYDLVGIPLLGSRTMAILTDIEYITIQSIIGMSITYTIVITHDKKDLERNTNLIKNGEYESLGEFDHTYILISNLDYVRKYSVPYHFVYLDILCNIGFSIRLTNMVYFHVEGFDDAFAEEMCDIDSIASITIRMTPFYNKKKRKSEERERIVFMNEGTLIPLDKLLKLI